MLVRVPELHFLLANCTVAAFLQAEKITGQTTTRERPVRTSSH